MNKDFDDGLLQKITEAAHEDESKDISLPPDVSNYMIFEVSDVKVSSFLTASCSCFYYALCEFACLKPAKKKEQPNGLPRPVTRVRPRRKPRAKTRCFCHFGLSRDVSGDLGRALQTWPAWVVVLEKTITFHFIYFFKHALSLLYIHTHKSTSQRYSLSTSNIFSFFIKPN